MEIKRLDSSSILPSSIFSLGCDSLAIRNPEWEDEYCSNECVVAHCSDVFADWVAGNQSSETAKSAWNKTKAFVKGY